MKIKHYFFICFILENQIPKNSGFYIWRFGIDIAITIVKNNDKKGGWITLVKLIQCVPNFSEGRDQGILDQILNEIRSVEGVKLLDYSMDKDHNRSVVTFIGDPEGVAEAAFKSTKKASELIEMSQHKGEHPRMGATDVIPLIPISDVTMDDCIELSKQLGLKIGNELGISVFLYEKSASAPHRENLAEIGRASCRERV